MNKQEVDKHAKIAMIIISSIIIFLFIIAISGCSVTHTNISPTDNVMDSIVEWDCGVYEEADSIDLAK